MEQIRGETAQVGKEIEDMEKKLYQKQRSEGFGNNDNQDSLSSHHSDQ